MAADLYKRKGLIHRIKGLQQALVSHPLDTWGLTHVSKWTMH